MDHPIINGSIFLDYLTNLNLRRFEVATVIYS